jgi:hypothetical protein
MALYTVGNRQTVSKEGIAADTLLYPGDIVEFYLVPSKSINKYNALPALLEAFKMKNTYPDLVIHYLNLDTDLITVQCSVAPPKKLSTGYGGRATGQVQWTAIAIIIVCATVLAALWGFVVNKLINIAYERWLKTGSLSFSAVKCDDSACTHPNSFQAPFTIDSKSGTTPVTIKDLDAGDYTITWGAVSGYRTPSPSKVTVVAGAVTSAPLGKYYKQGVTPPTTGLLVIDTTPVKGTVYINGTKEGTAPISKEVEVGDYTVSFGDIQGWNTPPPQTITVPPGERVPITGTYTKPAPGWWASLPTWARGAIVVGGAVLIGGIGVSIALSKVK